MKYTSEQIKKISNSDPDTIASFITILLVHIENLEIRVSELERQLGSNSYNSSKPPSSYGLRKPKSPRPSGGKKEAPRGHDGHTFILTPDPYEIIRHEVNSCAHCSASLLDIPAQSRTRRQVVDLPLPRLFVTEHQTETKTCPCCGLKQQSVFPEEVTISVQYGPG